MSKDTRMSDTALRLVKQENAGDQAEPIAPTKGRWISLV